MASRDASPPMDNLPDGSSFKVGIAVAQWNPDVTQALLNGAQKTLAKAGVPEQHIEIIEVPGSFELPWGARHLLSTEKRDLILCLGCIIKGETKHDDYIANAVANGIMQLGLSSGVPIIFGVVTTNTPEQALDRAGGNHGNKGAEAAATGLQLAHISAGKQSGKKTIGY